MLPPLRCAIWTARTPCKLLFRDLTRSTHRAFCASSSEEGKTEVFFVDPRTAFQEHPATAASAVRITVPRSFLPTIASPTFELGQADDPMSSWVIGQPAEIFEYSFAGHVRTQSGWVGAITQQSWEDLQATTSWEALQASAANADGGLRGPSPGQPFLFVGQILEAPSAAVYEKRQGEALQGLLITTSEDEVSTP